MSKVTFDYTKASQFISEHEVEYMKKLTLDAKETLLGKSGAGNDFLGCCYYYFYFMEVILCTKIFLN